MSGITGIPLYLNSRMVSNLFTILIAEFSITETESIKKQVTLGVNTPLSEIIKGQYIQGDVSLQVLNELSQSQTLEFQIKEISVFINLMKILNEHNLLKQCNPNNNDKIPKINKGDYVQLNCELSEDPLIKWFKDMEGTVNHMSYVNPEKADKLNQTCFMQGVKNALDKYNDSPSTNVIMKNCYNGNTGAYLKLEKECFQENMNHIFEGPVTVVGKVANSVQGKQMNNCDLYYNNFFKYMNEKSLNNVFDELKNMAPNVSIPNIPETLLFYDLIQVLLNIIPLAILV
ncbi:DUF6414 family protein [Hathewaya limosa]|uniref:Uncharacterized protein n=1 Tax=Hathewaya limosa TaxID=1536 RepID=A0ABU0JNN8_HATLI|nr:hypothetical protein [Hathewaya limosa]MDQ0478699.1 hypothetical protein [Hathewaya limosa]